MFVFETGSLYTGLEFKIPLPRSFLYFTCMCQYMQIETSVFILLFLPVHYRLFYFLQHLRTSTVGMYTGSQLSNPLPSPFWINWGINNLCSSVSRKPTSFSLLQLNGEKKYVNLYIVSLHFFILKIYHFYGKWRNSIVWESVLHFNE